MDLIFIQLLNGFQFGVLLFLVSAGLTLVFGIVNFLNLAHGAFYMIGAFLCASLTMMTGSFIWGILLSLPLMALLGIVFEFFVARHLYRLDHLDQVLATFGCLLASNSFVQLIWGVYGMQVPLPDWLSGQTVLLGIGSLSSYRLLIIFVGLIVAGGLYWMIQRTHFGILVRAAASNRTMLAILGVDERHLLRIVFALSAILAGLAGMMILPVTGASAGMGNEIVLLAFLVVIVGGYGSIKGAFVASILLGILDTMARAFSADLWKILINPSAAAFVSPVFSAVAVYLIVAVILFIMPRGLCPPKLR